MEVYIPAINSLSEVNAFECQALLLKSHEPSCIATGIIDEIIEDCVQVAISHLNYHRKRYSIPGKTFQNKLHVHFTDSSYAKEGSSAGFGILLSLLVYLSSNKSSKKLLVSGEIDLHGSIYSIGGVNEKYSHFNKNSEKYDYLLLPKGNEFETKCGRVFFFTNIYDSWKWLREVIKA